MPQILWSQDYFAKGELTPLLYSRVTLQAYYQGLKRAKNVICFPQGTAAKRFGTRLFSEVFDVTDYTQVYFKSFQYLNECCYLVVIRSGFIDVYLEGERVATVVSPIVNTEVLEIDHTVLDNRFRVTTGIYIPHDLRRFAIADNPIIGFGSDTFVITNPLTAGMFFPARFTLTGVGPSIPITVPQLHLNRTYFIRAITTTTLRVYNTVQDAAANINWFTIVSAGVGANVSILNAWTFTPVVFRNFPVFDFTGGYDTSIFTPSALSGYGITIARGVGPFNFTSRYIGGIFAGNGGVGRIQSVNGTTDAIINVITPFNSLDPIPGNTVFIAEPAWSDLRGWPRKCSSFQNRSFFANTDSLSNGLWGSVVNDYDDFNEFDLEADDAAISWFPSSDNVNFIQFIVPYRSLTIHTNSGVYSTPLSVETAITPNNFSLSLQDTHPAEAVQPAGIDNQIIAISGNDVHSLLWDGFNNAYTSNIISVANDHLIRTPVDEAPYTDLIRAGSRYMFIVNEDGTMAVYQTLITENVSGFTEAVLEQSYGNAYFRWVTSNFDGRAWFLTEREIGITSAPGAIVGGSANSLLNNLIIFATDTATPMVFVSGFLPVSDPPLTTGVTYWAVGIISTSFRLYRNQEDALAGVNVVTFTSPGSGGVFNAFPLESRLFIEQLDFDAQMDCVGYYPTPTTTVPTPAVSTISGQTRFDAQDILMQGDGFGFSTNVVFGDVNFEAHGMEREVTDAQYGFPINVEITPLPISLSMNGNPKSSNLVDTKHLRYATFLLTDTIGGTISQGGRNYPIALNTLNQIIPGDPPVPQSGIFEISVYNAWDDFRVDNFTINHTEPFGIRLTGIFYKVDAG